MVFGMNAATAHDEEYDKAIDNFRQAHLAQQNTMNSEMQTLKQ